MLIGYTRVSKTEQNLDRQLDQLKSCGCEKIFSDKITGMTMDRPEMNKMFEQLRAYDTIVIMELSRFGRSVKDLLELVERVEAAGAQIRSLKEPWLDTETAQGKMFFTVFAGISQFERDLISQRTKEGLESARARGRNGGRPKLDPKKVEMAIKMYKSEDYSLKEITEVTEVSKKSLYRYLNK